MKKKEKLSTDASADMRKLRERAEKEIMPDGKRDIAGMSPDDIAHLMHELETHQIELEMQNEDLRRAQEELIESHERLTDLYDFAPVGYLTLSDKGLILETNLTLAEMLGVERGQLIKQPFSAFVMDEDIYYLHLRTMLDKREKQSCELRLKTRGAEFRWARIECVLEDAPQEEGIRIRAIIHDITERRQAEETYRNLLTNLNAGVVVHAPDTSILLSNPAAAEMLGLSEEQMAGKQAMDPQWKFLREDGSDLPLEEYPVNQVLSTNKPLRNLVVGVNRPQTGDTAWVLVNGFPGHRDSGQIEQIVITFIDISERKQAEEERLSLERQVQHAQKLESLGVLAGGIAHDFNNLLMAILGNADLALDELAPHAPARENIQEIEKASRRAADLAKQMLAYSGKGRFVIEPIDLNGFVEEMAHLLEVSISKKAVLKYNFANNLPVFDGDATQIRQIIMNLIVNASEAIGDKSGVIALSTGAMDCDSAYLTDIRIDESLPEGLYVYIEVSDTGCGMDRETIGKIFDPFFTTKFTGRGLGMAAVLGIVRGHKGAVKIYSEVGKGTTFKILFPATEAPGDGVAVQGKAEADGKAWRGEGTILIADDEETVCAVGKQMLERMGFSILTAPDGREAVEVFREHAEEIVCILLDLTMPHLDGEEAFREIRRINPEVHVILCSGYNMQDATQRFAGKGLAGFLQKPYTMAELREKLKEILSAAAKGE